MACVRFMAYLAVAMLSGSALAELNPQDIFRQVEVRSAPPQESVELRMITKDASGSSKERWLTITRKNGKDQRALVRLEKPSDLKGVAVLSVSSNAKEEQWLYLPSTKKTRRILGSSTKGRFLDSEIAYEDLKISTYAGFNNKIVSQNNQAVEIESIAKKGTDSSYSRVRTWVSLPDYRLLKMAYWDSKGKLLKETEFHGYQKVGDKYWRAKFMQVLNLQTKRKTTLELKKISLKTISDADVSLAALEE